jgi:hypothetical protein
MTESERRLCSILLSDRWFVEVVRAVRDCNPPEWVVGGGVIRNIVWDFLHGFTTPTLARDFDVAFFDPMETARERDTRIEARLRRLLPGVPWQVTNQAGVHLWYEAKFGHPISPIQSIEDGVSRWPETATSVAVRLLPDERLVVIAPCGLEDLFDLVLPRNGHQVTAEYFERRTFAKAIATKWPKVTIVRE